MERVEEVCMHCAGAHFVAGNIYCTTSSVKNDDSLILFELHWRTGVLIALDSSHSNCFRLVHEDQLPAAKCT